MIARSKHLLLPAEALFAASALLLASGCGRAPAAAVPVVKPVLVRTEIVAYSNEAVPISATGVLARRTEADLSFKIGGVVEAVLVRVGDRVIKGQILAQLRLEEIEAQTAQARSALEKARRDLERVERLRENAAVSLENFQDARTVVDVAEAQLRIAEFNRRYAAIVAPADGRVLRRLAEPDEYAVSGRAILGFATDADGWIVRVGLAERDVARVQLGDRAELAGAAGRVTQISEAADLATRTIQVEIALDTAPPVSRSGAVAPVTLLPSKVAPRPVVPASVLIEGAGRTASVFLLNEGARAAQRVPVEIEALQGTRAFLRTPLARSARLIVQGGEYLRDGTVVEEQLSTTRIASSSGPGQP